MDDDDSAPVDDDDSTSDDDDSTSDDDDATSPPVLPVDQAANGAVVFVRFDGVDRGAVAASIFANSALSPSAEEAALQEHTEVTLPTTAPLDGFRDLPPDAYSGPYALETGGVFGVVDGVSVPLVEEFDGGWSNLDLSSSQLPVGSSWSAQFTGDGPYSGFHDAPAVPARPVLSGEGLLGHTLFLKPGQDVDLQVTPPSPVEPDIFTITGFGTPARAWGLSSSLTIPSADLPSPGKDGLPFFHQRNARVREDGDPSLVLMSGNWLIGEIVQLETTDVFLRPADPEPGEVAVGQTLSFTPEPALTDPTLPYVVNIGGVDFDGAVVDDELRVTIADPVQLGWGWRNVEVAIPNGVAYSAIRVGQTLPGCDVQEFGSNDALGGANPFAGGQVLCGVFEAAGDADFARFEATMGATYEIQVWGRRAGSRANAELVALDSLGGQLGQGDFVLDGDPRLELTASATGPIFLQVQDSDGEGGAEYDWRLQVRALP